MLQNQTLNKVLYISGSLDCHTYRFAGTLHCDNKILEGNLSPGGDKLPYYDESYVITPKVITQVLHTANKSMTADMRIKRIPYEETTNISGGTTIVIGGDING